MVIQWVTPKPKFNADSYVQIELLEGQTEKNVHNLFESLKKGELKDRVVSEGPLNKNFKIDNAFRVSRSMADIARETMNQWVSRKTQFQWIMTVGGGVALDGFVLSLNSDRWYLIAGLTMAVSLLIFAGIAYASYLEADHECHLWTKPEEDFLQRRDRALGSTLPQIFINECRYGRSSKQGALTDLEVLVLWKRYFKDFAERLLKFQPKNEEENQVWLAEFLNNNPLSSEFFKEDLEVLDAQGWEEVQEFQQQIDALKLPLQYGTAYQVLQNAKDVLIDGKSDELYSCSSGSFETPCGSFESDSEDYASPENA